MSITIEEVAELGREAVEAIKAEERERIADELRKLWTRMEDADTSGEVWYGPGLEDVLECIEGQP